MMQYFHDIAVRKANSMGVFADGDATFCLGDWRAWEAACVAEGRTIPPKEFKALPKEQENEMLTLTGKEIKDLADVLGAWVPVSVALPEKDVWVQVFEDDNDNPQDAYTGNMLKAFRQRVTPAKLLSVDSEGYADWYLCYVGGGPVRHVRNVTHWAPMLEAPNTKQAS